MNKALVGAALLVASIFGTGYVLGQTHGATPSAAASLTQTQATAVPAAGEPPRVAIEPHADGIVTAISGDTITVKADTDRVGSNEQTGVTTIVLTGTTKYGTGRDGTVASKASITVGSYIVAEGALSADGKTLTATQVMAGGFGGRGGFGHFGHSDTPHADGTVTAVSGDTVTVKADTDRSGTNEYAAVTTVVLTANTTYQAGHDSTSTASKASITVGTEISAEGTVSADGITLTATTVEIRPASGAPGGNFH